MDRLKCPTCGSDNLQVDSLGEEILCDNGHMLGVYDKAKHITIEAWIYK